MDTTVLEQALEQATATQAEVIAEVDTSSEVNTEKMENEAQQILPQEPFKIYKSKKEFDDHAAGLKGNAKKEAEKEILSLLGLKADEKDKLTQLKQLYEETLSETEKNKNAIEAWQTEKINLNLKLSEQELLIAALTQISGQTKEDIVKSTLMAKSLASEEVTFEEAFTDAFNYIVSKKNPTVVVPSIPKGGGLPQPDVKPVEKEKEPANLSEALQHIYKK